ncbi:hypothetical protein HN51_003851 [Arachis hypogaea]|uniref:Uncharacterized protein n=2 Tax=Arachis TaxID=3817 RepID=A0A445DJJ5_ARAHY|nr:uncharacterized protein LOC107482952 [Arachis duranensis]XP_025693981.1 uncharacterized protein LOC112795969 [Arachis hypogaea]QHO37398.1 uncharacterized protein DS421_4g111140 [Arachis hypogaea]RYR63349.1 hypothetical protein Ahy_A04g021148 [Arachis hypogaea]
MKKLYRKGTVHPSPPIISDQLSFLPATILTLTAALTPEDREVLAYLISCSSSSNNPRRTTTTTSRSSSASGGGDHAPVFSCNCFRCYMSYWVRWDASPNRQLIHEIIDAFEEWLAHKGGKKHHNNGGRKDKRNKRGSNSNKMQQSGELLNRSESVPSSESTESSSSTDLESVVVAVENSSNDSDEDGERVEEDEKGSVRRFVSFIGERIWGAWGQ